MKCRSYSLDVLRQQDPAAMAALGGLGAATAVAREAEEARMQPCALCGRMHHKQQAKIKAI